MKKTIAFFLALCLLFAFTGCAKKTVPGSVDAEPTTDALTADEITVVDHLGREVTVPADIQRIAVVGILPLPSVLTVFFNSAEKLVSIPKASMSAARNGLLGKLYPEILDVDTNDEDINAEELATKTPDVVFCNEANAELGERLTNAGFSVVMISVNKWGYNCIETLNHWIDLISQMFPADAKADIVRARSEQMYELVQSRVSGIADADKARMFVLFRYDENGIFSSGKNFFGQWWCDAVGAVNVAEEIEKDNAVPVNMEQVYAWNPDTMIITNFTPAQPEDILNNTIGNYDWSTVTAAQNGRIFKMPLGMYRSYTPGADTPVTLLWLAKSVYPDLFADIDVTAEAKSYYQDVFGVELSDEDIASIFTPTAAAAAAAGAR
ncbi:MAG: ABC transporter substrate-binding protein [Clostridia bacterium]|nr:ABC transporter substrate-binding protein [Clostridia bacterium]